MIFGATGGVMEAALRTAADWLTGGEMKKLDFEEVRGVARASRKPPTRSAIWNCMWQLPAVLPTPSKVLESVKSGEKHYDFIEIMGCPGGCVNGGGQPAQPAEVRNFVDLRAMAQPDSMRMMPARPCARAMRTRQSRSFTRTSSANLAAIWPMKCCIPIIESAAGS